MVMTVASKERCSKAHSDEFVTTFLVESLIAVEEIVIVENMESNKLK